MLYDYECSCGLIQERIEPPEKMKVRCPCGKMAKRIISAAKVYTANEDAPWLKTVLEVVSKDDDAPHVVRFRENPTRSNYKAWMKGEGLRPLENPSSGHGEYYEAKQERLRKEKSHSKDMADSIMKMRRNKNAISINN
jgi:hypothetical protein